MNEPEMETEEIPIPPAVVVGLLAVLGLGFALGWIVHAVVTNW